MPGGTGAPLPLPPRPDLFSPPPRVSPVWGAALSRAGRGSFGRQWSGVSVFLLARGDVLQPLLRWHREGSPHERGGRPGRAVWPRLRPFRGALQSAEPRQGPGGVGPPRPDRPAPLQGEHAGESGGGRRRSRRFPFVGARTG